MSKLDILIYIAIGFSGAVIAFMVYRSVPYIRFAYPVAKVETLGNPFITEKVLSQLLETKTLTSFKNIVNSYKDFSIEGEKAEEIQRSLDLHMIKSIEVLKKESPRVVREFYNSFIDFLDAYNLKNFLKAKIKGVKIDVSPISEEFRRIVDSLRDIEIEDLYDELREFGLDIDKGATPLDIDVRIDRYVLDRLKTAKVSKIARTSRDEFIGRLLDIMNMKNLIRLKLDKIKVENYDRFFLGDGREIAEWRFKELFMAKNLEELIIGLEGTSYYDIMKQAHDESKRLNNLQLLEASLDKIMMRSTSDISLKNFPFFGPLLKFIIARYFEIKNLKIMAKGIEENLPKDRIRPLLVVGG